MRDGLCRVMPGRAAIAALAVIGGMMTLAASAQEPVKPGVPVLKAKPAADPREAAVRKASADYAAGFNERKLDALGDQWTENAELIEGEGRLVGRASIMRSIKAWLERYPQSTLAIAVDGVEFPAATLARVGGRMTFTSKPGAKPVVSRFASLRVLEDGVWRIAESAAQPNQAAVLEELEWLIGTWKNDPARDGDEVEATFSRSLGDAFIVGRTTFKPKSGAARESLQVIHADRATGLVRTWVFDSTGARAEGVIEADGASYHQSLAGVPAESAGGGVVRWVQVIAPAGDGRFTLHSIERTLDGAPLPDGKPMDFRKVR